MEGTNRTSDHDSPEPTPSSSVVFVSGNSAEQNLEEMSSKESATRDARLHENPFAALDQTLDPTLDSTLDSTFSSPYIVPTSEFSEKEVDDLSSVDSTLSSGSHDAHAHFPLQQIPDLRFGVTFNKNIHTLREQNKSYAYIFTIAILRDQIIMPWLNGFAWGFGGHLLRWWKTSNTPQRDSGRWKGFFGRMNKTLGQSIAAIRPNGQP